MNVDERIEKLTARHEALAQSMELTHHDIQDLLKVSRLHSEQLQQDAEHIRALVRIAEIHEQRLSGLEDKQ
jgi:hypothetical protein